MSNPSSTCSRRTLISAAGFATMSVVAAKNAGVPTHALADTAPAQQVSTDEADELVLTEFLEADLVVVGAGPAGCAAICEALDLGATVVALEKTSDIGGMTFGTEGVFGWGSKMQEEKGCELPAILEIIGEELTYSNYRVDANLWRDFVSQSGQTIDWLVEKGVEFERVDTYQGASFFESFHWWPGGSGTNFGPIMAKYLDGKPGLTLLTECAGKQLVMENGMCVGVVGQKVDGTVVEARGRGIVVCTGGFSCDKDLMTELSGTDWSTSGGFDTPATGDGHRMMRAAGGQKNTCCFINTMCVQTPEGTQDMVPINIGTNYQCLPMVNQFGERFMAEDTFAKYFAMLTLNAMSTQKKTWTLFDPNAVERLEFDHIDHGFVAYQPGDRLEGLTAQLEQFAGCDNVKKGATIEELAEQIGADPATLKATVARWNEACALGYDEDFGVDPSILFPIAEEGPYYAVHPDRFVSASIGGIKTDRKMRVLDAAGEPIPGLFSAGVDSCCLYKETYNIQLSGGMQAYNFYSGRNAARVILGV